MPQLGSGVGSGYPQAIDTKQLFANGTPEAPDDATRLDAQLANDTLDAIVKMEHALGANVQGVYGSLAARLQQAIPGGSVSLATFAFSEMLVWTIPGTTHRLGTAAVFLQVYSADAIAQVLQPDRVTIDPTTYDITLTFAAAQSGRVVIGAGPPVYSATFTNQTVLTIAAGVHNLGTPYLLVSLYTVDAPLQVLTPASVVIDPVTALVTVTFLFPTSGTLLLSAMGPRHVTAFTSETLLIIPGTSHQLQSAALLVQVSNETGAVIEASSVYVDTATFTVYVNFLVAQSGAVLLARASDITGREFEMRDGGITNSTAARIFSASGDINLQIGESGTLNVRNKTGAFVTHMTEDGKLGLGTFPPYQLTLNTDSAAKPATSTWTVISDERLKEVIGTFTEGLEVLQALEAVRYRYNGLGGMPTDRQEHIGFLAQTVQAVAPYMVQSYRGRLTPEGQETDILTLNIDALNYLLLNGLKELLTLNTALTARVDALEITVTTLQGAQQP